MNNDEKVDTMVRAAFDTFCAEADVLKAHRKSGRVPYDKAYGLLLARRKHRMAVKLNGRQVGPALRSTGNVRVLVYIGRAGGWA